MKRIIFILSFLFIGQKGFSQDSLYCRIIPSHREAKAIISFYHLNARKVILKITQEDGDVVFTESIEGKNHYAKIFNFSQMKDGDYMLSYQLEGIERSCTLSKRNELISVNNAHKLQGFYQPVQFRLTNDHQALLFVDNEVRKELTVSLLDKEGELIFFDVFNSSEDYRKKINLRNLSKGSYTLLVQRGDLIYHEDILLE